MALIPLKIPAGFYRTGTELDASGRWRDGSLVRWRDGSLRPIGGWRVNENIASITTNAPRGYAYLGKQQRHTLRCSGIVQ